MNLVVEGMIAISCQTSSKSTEGNQRLISHTNLKCFPLYFGDLSVVTLVLEILE